MVMLKGAYINYMLLSLELGRYDDVATESFYQMIA